MKKLLLFLSLIGFSILSSIKVFALEPVFPERKERYVNDFVNILGDVSLLENKIKDFEDRTSNKIIVVIIDSLGGLSADQYASKLYEKWKIGQEKDNGVLILISFRERKIHIKVGYGLSQVLPAEVCNSIIKNEIASNFHKGNYLVGLERGIDAIILATAGEYQIKNKKDVEGFLVIMTIIIVVIFSLIIFSKIKQKEKRKSLKNFLNL